MEFSARYLLTSTNSTSSPLGILSTSSSLEWFSARLATSTSDLGSIYFMAASLRYSWLISTSLSYIFSFMPSSMEYPLIVTSGPNRLVSWFITFSLCFSERVMMDRPDGISVDMVFALLPEI